MIDPVSFPHARSTSFPSAPLASGSGSGKPPAFPGGGMYSRSSTSRTPALSPSPASLARPPSFSSERRSSSISTASQSLSLVGSYDESLLSGRMSTTPSQPFDFDAELGVLGLPGTKAGEKPCPRKLRCPPHLSMRFEARYYQLGTPESPTASPTSATGGWTSSFSGLMTRTLMPRTEKCTAGSPYVGSIDLESSYFEQLEGITQAVRRYRANRHNPRGEVDEGVLLSPDQAVAKLPAFPGYQVPARGQIQLVIQNQNLTAVKVFLVKYDLSDMQPGTKTFMRQKSYVCAAPAAGEGTKEKEAMRFAVHLQFACPPLAEKNGGRSTAAQAGPTTVNNTFIASTRDAPLPSQSRYGLTNTCSTPNATAGSKREQPINTTPKIYLHRHIRVVFAATGLDSFERLDVVTETAAGIMHDTRAKKQDDQCEWRNVYSSYDGPTNLWRRARNAVKKQLAAALEEEMETAAALEAEEMERRMTRIAIAQESQPAEPLQDLHITVRSASDTKLEEDELKAVEALSSPIGEWEEDDDRFDTGSNLGHLESSVHSAFGIPAPRSRSASRRSTTTSSAPGAGLGLGIAPDGLDLIHTRLNAGPRTGADGQSFAAVVDRQHASSRDEPVPALDEDRIGDAVSQSSEAGFGINPNLPTLPGTISGGHAMHRRSNASSSSTSSATTSDQELLGSWHRAMRRSGSLSNSHGSLVGSLDRSNASVVMSTSVAALMMQQQQ